MGDGPSADSNIAIIGGGLGGLALAIALRRSGIEDVVLFEQQPEHELAADQPSIAAPGDPLTLPPNATRVLRALGARLPLELISYQPSGLQQRGGRSGFLMSELPLGELAANRYGAPYLISEYHSLRRLLLQLAQNAGVLIRYEHICIGREQQTATFSDHSRHRARLLVGADGTASTLRSSLPQGAPKQAHAGQQWSGSIAIERVPESLQQPAVTLWLGNGGYISHCLLPDHAQLHWRACQLGTHPSPPTSVGAAFGAWQATLLQLLQSTVDVDSAALHDSSPPQALVDDAFALIGDAAHPLALHLDQGAALALEDAWVLSRFIDQLEHDPSAACAEYQRFRLNRVRLMTTRAQVEGQRRSAAPGLASFLDRAKTSLTSRFLPELAMQRLDWMFRYDCIRGFE